MVAHVSSPVPIGLMALGLLWVWVLGNWTTWDLGLTISLGFVGLIKIMRMMDSHEALAGASGRIFEGGLKGNDQKK